MLDPLVQQLTKIADELGSEGEYFHRPAWHAGQSLDDFQADVGRLRRYQTEGLLDILGERTESHAGREKVVSLTLRLTEAGVREWGVGRPAQRTGGRGGKDRPARGRGDAGGGGGESISETPHDALAKEAVEVTKGLLHALGVSPRNFTPQMALCTLLQWAAGSDGDEVAGWVLSGDQDRLWRRAPGAEGGLLVEGDDPIHEHFRRAWQDFLDGQLETGVGRVGGSP